MNNLFSDKELRDKSEIFRREVAKLLGIDWRQVLADSLCTNDHEASIWIDTPISGARIAITFSGRIVFSICVEYPMHRDGHFATYHCNSLVEAVNVFKFANSMLDDIRAAIQEII